MLITQNDNRHIAMITGGIGKSTLMLNDIKETAERTKDKIIIIDIFGGYKELVTSLGGQYIDVTRGLDDIPESRIICFSLKNVPSVTKAKVYANLLQRINTVVKADFQSSIRTYVYLEDLTSYSFADIQTVFVLMGAFKDFINTVKQTKTPLIFIIDDIEAVSYCMKTDFKKLLGDIKLIVFKNIARSYNTNNLLRYNFVTKSQMDVIKMLVPDEAAEITNQNLVILTPEYLQTLSARGKRHERKTDKTE